MSKRGQITIFIIIGIVFLLLVAGLIYFQSRDVTIKEQQEIQQAVAQLPGNAQSVRSFVDSCVADTSERAVFYFGMIGGDIIPNPWPAMYQYDEKFSVPFYYMKGVPYAPTKKDAEAIMARYIEQELKNCTDFTQLAGLTVELDRVTATANMDEDKVNFFVTFPIRATFAGAATVDIPEKYFASVEARVLDAVEIAHNIVEREVLDDLFIHWDYLTEVTEDGLEITAYPEDGETIVYKIVDPQSLLFKSEQFTLHFANYMKTTTP